MRPTLPNPAPPAMSVRQAADALDCHSNTVRRYIARGRLPAYRVGPKLLRVRAEDVAALARPLVTARQP